MNHVIGAINFCVFHGMQTSCTFTIVKGDNKEHRRCKEESADRLMMQSKTCRIVCIAHLRMSYISLAVVKGVLENSMMKCTDTDRGSNRARSFNFDMQRFAAGSFCAPFLTMQIYPSRCKAYRSPLLLRRRIQSSPLDLDLMTIWSTLASE